MPSGKTHDAITFILAAPTFAIAWGLSGSIALALVATCAMLFGGLMFGPDLDIQSRQYTRWGVFRFLWLPYRMMFKHRSRWSHGIIFGTLIRVVYFVKDRIKLAMKGDREARAILIRDSNKVVATGVIHNPRITDHEIENIAAMRTVSDEVLRQIAMNRAWARSYPIIHNLARNPRTPIATAMSILPRIRTKDLQHISQNRNVSEAVRRQAYRLSQTRSGH